MSVANILSLPLRNTHREFTEDEVMNWLRESEVFSDLHESDLRPFLVKLRIMNFKPLDEVISQGKFSAALYIVTAGRFLVLRPDAPHLHHATSENDLIELDTFEQGQCFGEYSLIDKKPASASVVAAERSQAIQIPKPVFDGVLMADYRVAKTIYHNLLKLLTARLRQSLKV